MKIKIVTSIYSDLYGTKFGGRIGRKEHYRWSLISLMKMSEADFVCYTSENEYQDLYDFFYNQNKVDKNKLVLKTYNLSETPVKEIIKKWKNFESTKLSDRCIEIQYMKFFWSLTESKGYDYTYWFDAGLSHSGLIPNKFLGKNELGYRGYFESDLFNNNFLQNLIQKSDNKFLIVGKENSRNYWSGTVNPKHFFKHDSSVHIIGGFFGGLTSLWTKIVYLFNKYLYQVSEEDKRLYHEEDIMTLLFRNHQEMFEMLYFETWWHENERISGVDIEEHVKNNRSFYKILEDLN
jgi:hypothetical protein